MHSSTTWDASQLASINAEVKNLKQIWNRMLDKLVIIIFYLANFKFNVVYHLDSFDVSWASGRTICKSKRWNHILSVSYNYQHFCFPGYYIKEKDAVAVWGKILIHARDPRIRLITNHGFIVFVFLKQFSIFILHLPLWLFWWDHIH